MGASCKILLNSSRTQDRKQPLDKALPEPCPYCLSLMRATQRRADPYRYDWSVQR
jgi:hypothetical protein